MSLTQSLNSALTGLTAVSRRAEVVSNNIANQGTAAYGKRSVLLGTQTTGGVRVQSIQRHSNPILLGERRLSQADLAFQDSKLAFLQQIETTLAGQNNDGSLLARINAFESALISASGEPGSEAHLAQVLNTANSLADGLRQASASLQSSRETAEIEISSQVGRLNSSLTQVAELNRSIIKMTALGKDVSSLLDQRQSLVDDISTIVPLREVTRSNGTIVLYTTGGATLLDGQAAVFDFTPSGTIRAESGTLNGITLNGIPVSMGANSSLRGGSLAAQFEIRDTLAPQAQSELDALAFDLSNRLAQADTTRGATQPGLFTDMGALAQNTAGLAARLKVNDAVDPKAGGALWRIRGGLGTTAPTDLGDSSVLQSMSQALSQRQSTTFSSLEPRERNLSEFASDFASSIAAKRLASQSQSTFTATKQTTLLQAEAEQGVDSDVEMQNLLLIETAWSANARVISVIDQMLATLMEL